MVVALWVDIIEPSVVDIELKTYMLNFQRMLLFRCSINICYHASENPLKADRAMKFRRLKLSDD